MAPLERAAAPARRRWLVLAPAALLAACAGDWLGARSITLPRQRLQDAIARSFPVQRGIGGLVELSLQAPALTLRPERNRLGLALDWVLTEPPDGRRLAGHLALDFGLRYDAEAGAIRMVDVRVSEIDAEALDPAPRALLARLAPPLLGQLLSGQVLYRVPAEPLARARQRGLQVRALTVLPDALRLDLDSAQGD
ncbi:MAG TPA: hypothetical protein PKA16_05770 [Ottowia sp.]|mgnify:CR=1 FL=1|uniref:hypothetical protein n=1 Tax=Ottowia sp. TaxID=1898956 RepID=UPI002CC62861|nr:hypothetical protein [Ottowia sp.]HMN20884.1 hypothetical protein [Ottowia sp.]